jgi:TPR repeat protein
MGAVEGWLALGRLNYFGKSVPKDYEKAFYYYSAVDRDTDNRIADLMLGACIWMGLESSRMNQSEKIF